MALRPTVEGGGVGDGGAGRFPAWPKEPFCGWSHLLGAGLALAGLVALLVLARGRPWIDAAAFAVYGVSLVLLYAASGLYHSLHTSPAQADAMQRLDHIAIYGLIAGTYTPVCLIALRGDGGRGLLAAEWGMAACGIALSLLWRRAPDWPRVVLYTVMGWLALAVLGPLHRTLSPAAFAWMMAGGGVYSLGAVVFVLDRPHLLPGRFSAHDLWHVFVLGGSACHFMLMLCLLAPPG